MRLGEASAPWSSTVLCSDASPGGHGLAYAHVPEPQVRSWAQAAYHRGDAFALYGKFEHLRVDPAKASVMNKAKLPLDDYRWTLLGRPGFYRHITFEEASAHVLVSVTQVEITLRVRKTILAYWR